MRSLEDHRRVVLSLQQQLKELLRQAPSTGYSNGVALRYRSSNSCTTRTKRYKKNAPWLDCRDLDQVLSIDPEKRVVVVEPRVTMESLLRETLAHGLVVPVLPEFRTITVGGALMGVGAESGSHRWGCLNDICGGVEVLCGDGSLLRASPFEEKELFYGLQGSYGSLGTLTLAELRLLPAKAGVTLRYYRYPSVEGAIESLKTLASSCYLPDFLEGIAFSENLVVVIEGRLASLQSLSHTRFSTHGNAPWYYQHVRESALKAKEDVWEESMTHEDYFFRHDRGAFWVGSYLCRLPLLARFALQGILGLFPGQGKRSLEKDIRKYHAVKDPGWFSRCLVGRWLSAKRLWQLLHLAEDWVQDRLVLQDLTVPLDRAAALVKDVFQQTGVAPLWLLPIRGTRQPQLFAPHLLPTESSQDLLINIGVYGVPGYKASLAQLTQELERQTTAAGGKKVLYSRSIMTPEEFWRLYSRADYEALRQRYHAKGVWREITQTVLSR